MKKSYAELVKSGEWRGSWENFEKYGYEFLKVEEECGEAVTLEKIKKAKKRLECFVKKFKKDREVTRAAWGAINGLRMVLMKVRAIEERKEKARVKK